MGMEPGVLPALRCNHCSFDGWRVFCAAAAPVHADQDQVGAGRGQTGGEGGREREGERERDLQRFTHYSSS